MFDPSADIDIDYFEGDRPITEFGPETGALTVRTCGLARSGLPELELVEVPPTLNGEAALLLDTAADAALQHQAFEDGRLWTSRLPDGFLIAARVVAMPSGVLRLVDPAARDDEAARMAICAVAVSRSRLVRQPTDEDEAEPELASAILERAIAWFPGQPGEGLTIANDELCNQGNSLAYLERSDHLSDPDAQSASYAMALERSRGLRLAEIDGPAPAPVAMADLAADARALIQALHDAARASNEAAAATGPGGMSFLFSPVLRLDSEGLHQPLAIGPAEFRAYFFEGDVATALASLEVRELAAAIHQSAVVNPIAALVLSRETARGVYEAGYHFNDRPPSRPFAFQSVTGNVDHVPFLSRILAALGRDLAAGLTLDECRARWYLTGVPNLRASAAVKMEALRSHEDDLYYAAYGL